MKLPFGLFIIVVLRYELFWLSLTRKYKDSRVHLIQLARKLFNLPVCFTTARKIKWCARVNIYLRNILYADHRAQSHILLTSFDLSIAIGYCDCVFFIEVLLGIYSWVYMMAFESELFSGPAYTYVRLGNDRTNISMNNQFNGSARAITSNAYSRYLTNNRLNVCRIEPQDQSLNRNTIIVRPLHTT